MAARLRREMPLTLQWNTTRMLLGTGRNGNRSLHHWMTVPPPAEVAPDGAKEAQMNNVTG